VTDEYTPEWRDEVLGWMELPTKAQVFAAVAAHDAEIRRDQAERDIVILEAQNSRSDRRTSNDTAAVAIRAQFIPSPDEHVHVLRYVGGGYDRPLYRCACGHEVSDLTPQSDYATPSHETPSPYPNPLWDKAAREAARAPETEQEKNNG